MKIFKNILVGIDLARCDPLDISGLSPIALEPIRWGIQLAKANAASLLLFSASNVSEEDLLPLAEEDRTNVRQTIYHGGAKVLQELVQQAKMQGVEAESKLVPGKGWLEIVRQVLSGKHDLVVVGPRALTTLRRMLFGSTSMRLLRHCPCPVLVTKPSTVGAVVARSGDRATSEDGLGPSTGSDTSHFNILVAADLKPSSEVAMHLGLSLAQQMNVHLDILHVVEYPLYAVSRIGLSDATQEEYRRKVRDHAQEILHAQLEKTDYKALGSRVEVHMAGGVGFPEFAIQNFIQAHDVHLLVMGTIGRGGIRGIMIGNTAERLLSEVHCSVLAVKPPDFVCPVEG